MSDFPANSVAFITGAGSGIGKAIAHRLILDGIRHIAIADILPERLSETAASLHSVLSASKQSSSTESSVSSALSRVQIDPKSQSSSSSSGLQVLELPINCTVEKEVEDAVAKTVKKFGRLDFAVNSAGIAGSVGARIGQLDFEEYRRVTSLNQDGTWLCAKAEVKALMKQEMRDVTTGLPLKTRGAIVNIASALGLQAWPVAMPYVTSKHAAVGITRSSALDYAKDGIRINAVCPGFCRSNLLTDDLWELLGGVVEQATPMGRLGTPDEVAYYVSFLLSDKASYITGSAAVVDGGMTIA